MSSVAPTTACIAGAPRDFMKTIDLRSQSSFEYQYGWNVEELSDDDEKFETQTVFASEREGYCVIFFLRNLSDIWRMIVCLGEKSQRSSKRSLNKPKKGGG